MELESEKVDNIKNHKIISQRKVGFKKRNTEKRYSLYSMIMCNNVKRLKNMNMNESSRNKYVCKSDLTHRIHSLADQNGERSQVNKKLKAFENETGEQNNNGVGSCTSENESSETTTGLRRSARIKESKSRSSATESNLERKVSVRKPKVTRKASKGKQNTELPEEKLVVILPQIYETEVLERSVQTDDDISQTDNYAIQTLSREHEIPCRKKIMAKKRRNTMSFSENFVNPESQFTFNKRGLTYETDGNIQDISQTDEGRNVGELDQSSCGKSYLDECHENDREWDEDEINKSIYIKRHPGDSSENDEELEPDKVGASIFDVVYNTNTPEPYTCRSAVDRNLKTKYPKSNLRRKSRTKCPVLIDTYKYLDEDNNIKYIVGGYSESSFIRRVIIYIQSLKLSMGFIMNQQLIPGINFDSSMFSNIQMAMITFHDDLLPMLTYTVYNKDSNHYHEQLIIQLHQTNSHFIFLSTLDSPFYSHNQEMKYYPFDNDDENNYRPLKNFPRNEFTKMAENFYLFISTLIYGVFMKHTHVGVLQEMLEYFKLAFYARTQHAMSVD